MKDFRSETSVGISISFPRAYPLKNFSDRSLNCRLAWVLNGTQQNSSLPLWRFRIMYSIPITSTTWPLGNLRTATSFSKTCVRSLLFLKKATTRGEKPYFEFLSMLTLAVEMFPYSPPFLTLGNLSMATHDSTASCLTFSQQSHLYPRFYVKRQRARDGSE